MVYKGKLVKVSTNPNALRTNEVEGWTPMLPEAGEQFVLFSQALERGPEYVRQVTTSIVQKVYHGDNSEILFDTMNSTYKFTDIKPYEDEVLRSGQEAE